MSLRAPTHHHPKQPLGMATETQITVKHGKVQDFKGPISKHNKPEFCNL